MLLFEVRNVGYNTLTGEIELNGSPLEPNFLRLTIAREIGITTEVGNAREIIKLLAIVNSYPLMDEADKKKFGGIYSHFSKFHKFVPTKNCPYPN